LQRTGDQILVITATKRTVKVQLTCYRSMLSVAPVA
jgi:hypothetical protein